MSYRNGRAAGAVMAAAMAGLLASAWAVPAEGAEPVAGIVIGMKGKPQLKRKGSAKWENLKMNKYVNEGDTIETRAGELVSVAFLGGAEMRINERSTFEVTSGGGSEPTSLRTTVGQAWTRLLHGKAGLNIKTPSAVAAVRGTEADVESTEAASTIKVYEGHVDVFNDQGSQSLTAGQVTQAAAGSAPETPRALSPAETGTWQDGVSPKGDLESQLDRLNKEAEKRRNIELIDKNGKKRTFKLEKE